jgi:hypothetical protein
MVSDGSQPTCASTTTRENRGHRRRDAGDFPETAEGSQAHSVDHLAHPSGNSTETGSLRSLVPLKGLPDERYHLRDAEPDLQTEDQTEHGKAERCQEPSVEQSAQRSCNTRTHAAKPAEPPSSERAVLVHDQWVIDGSPGSLEAEPRLDA